MGFPDEYRDDRGAKINVTSIKERIALWDAPSGPGTLAAHEVDFVLGAIDKAVGGDMLTEVKSLRVAIDRLRLAIERIAARV